MKKNICLLAIVALASVAMLSALPASAEEAQTLNGEYIWSNRDTTGDLKAVFTPAGENRYDVSFYFQFRGKDHTYTGTAEGSLSSGDLKGTVQNEDKKRTWEFWGTFDETGVFQGKHQELRGEEKHDTGTMTLKG